MIGLMQVAGNSSQNSKKHVKATKAHIDCNYGINETTLLAACFDALKSRTNYDEDTSFNFDSFLKGIRSSIYTELVPTRKITINPMTTKHLCVVADTSSIPMQTTTRVQGPSKNSPSFPGVLDTLHREIFDHFKTSNVVIWQSLPIWIVETTKVVFTEVLKAFEKIQTKGEENRNISENDDYNVRNEMAYSCILNVVATLTCLDMMGVREVSCSSLPMIHSTSESSSNAEVLVILQREMTIDPSASLNVDDATPLVSVLSTAIGIALLRVLTGVTVSKKSRITPFVLQSHGYGMDYTNKSMKVSIFVGRHDDNDSGSDLGTENSRRSHCILRKKSLFHSDHIAHLETNLDDISGENLAFAIELLLQRGAIDAWATPIVMKKGRPAHTLHCLCKDNSEDCGGKDGDNNDNATLNSLLKLIFIHTSTLGVRIYRRVPRMKLERSMATVSTPFKNTSRKGRVDVKVSRFQNGEVVRKKAEFDHCKEIAVETDMPIQTVADQAIKAFERMNGNT